MKHIVWWSLLLVGLVMASQEEEATDELQQLQGRQDTTQKLGDLGAVGTNINDVITAALNKNPLEQLAVAFGNLFAALQNLITGGALPAKPIDLGDLAALKPDLTAGAGAITAGTLAALTALKTAVIGLIGQGVEVANFVLAIIALILLVVYLIETDGDIKGLMGYDTTGTGFYRRDGDDPNDSYSSYVNTARSLWNAPMVQRLTSLVHDAIVKYDDY